MGIGERNGVVQEDVAVCCANGCRDDPDEHTKLRVIDDGDSDDRSDDNTKASRCRNPCSQFFVGLVLLLFGTVTFFYTPLDLLMHERMKMMPGFPAFDWWLNPPENVLIKIYIFNVTNSVEFLNGSDPVLRLQEIGPIVYSEKTTHKNVEFNDNDTLTYTAVREPIFLPEMNTHIDFNATFYHPNIFLLGIASHLRNAFTFQKRLFSVTKSALSPSIIAKTTIYNYLWYSKNFALQLAKQFAPHMVPSDNMGIIHMMYETNNDKSTVFIGPRWGDERFFSLDRFRGSTTSPGFDEDVCNSTVRLSSEGLLYPQRLTKEQKLYYWRTSACKRSTLFFQKEETVNGVLGYKYILPDNAYFRKNDTEPDCHAGSPELPDGVSDLSKCYCNLPVGISLPHLKGLDPKYMKKISGLTPSNDDLTSYAVVEPLTGIPMESQAISQSNFVMGKIEGFSKDIQLFDEMIFPLYYIKIQQVGLPDYVWTMINTMVYYVPWFQAIMSSLCTLVGTLLFCRWFRLHCSSSTSFYSQNQMDKFAIKTILGDDKKSKQAVVSNR